MLSEGSDYSDPFTLGFEQPADHSRSVGYTVWLIDTAISETDMSDHAGVWIDHRKAVVVALTADTARTTVIVSKAVTHLERGGDRPLDGRFEPRQVPADDSQQRALTGQLNTFYDAVILAVETFDPLLLFGPGEAKHELHKRLKLKKRGAHVEAIETEDKMTDPQIVAKVRSHFGVGAPRAQAPRSKS